jgi:hypothetical protein
MATASIDNVRWNGAVTLPSPAPTWWFQSQEEATLQVTGLKARSNITVAKVEIGGQKAAVTGGSFTWPSSDGLDHRINAPLLSGLGVVDGVVLLGGAWFLGSWAAGTRKSRVKSRSDSAALPPSSAS